MGPSPKKLNLENLPWTAGTREIAVDPRNAGKFGNGRESRGTGENLVDPAVRGKPSCKKFCQVGKVGYRSRAVWIQWCTPKAVWIQWCTPKAVWIQRCTPRAELSSSERLTPFLKKNSKTAMDPRNGKTGNDHALTAGTCKQERPWTARNAGNGNVPSCSVSVNGWGLRDLHRRSSLFNSVTQLCPWDKLRIRSEDKETSGYGAVVLIKSCTPRAELEFVVYAGKATGVVERGALVLIRFQFPRMRGPQKTWHRNNGAEESRANFG
jgi:hypothetical protein